MYMLGYLECTKNQIHNETNTDIYYIKIIEELCWAKHLPLNKICAYLDYLTFKLTTEKDILVKGLYVTILRSSTTKIWVLQKDSFWSMSKIFR